MAEHRTEVLPSSYEMFAFHCSCGRIGGDHRSKEGAEEEAEMHRRGELQPWQLPPGPITPWSPEGRPFEGA